MKPFILSGVCNFTSGYGQWFCQLTDWLDAHDYPFRVIPIGPPPFTCSEAPLPLSMQRRIDRPCGGEEWTLQVAPPAYGLRTTTSKTAWYVLWESNRLPQEHVERLNKADLIITASAFNRDTFLAAGVTKPVEIAPLGVEPFWFADRLPRKGPFTFFTFGEANGVYPKRKDFDTILESFLCAFPNEPDVRLLIHSTPLSVWRTVRRDPRIEMKRRFLTSRELLRWVHRGDVFVGASRNEGFGLCPLQAMSTGVPVIAPHWSGPMEYLDHANSYPVLFDLKPIEGALPEYVGEEAVVQIDSMAKQMRTAREDPGLAHRGQAAKDTARRFAMDRSLEKLTAILAEYGIT